MSPNEKISKSISNVDNFISSLNLPRINIDLKEREDLDFSRLTHYDNKEVEDFLAIYGGYKAYLEIKTTQIESKVSILKASFEDLYSIQAHKVVSMHKSGRKPTKEEIRGQIMGENDELSDLSEEIIELEAILKREMGLLKAYDTFYSTVSRIVTLRTQAN